MRILYGIILGVLLISIFISGYKKRKDLFSPLCFFALYQFIRYVPIMIFSKEEAFFISLNDKTLLPTFCFETVFVISVLFGYIFFKKRSGIPIEKSTLRNKARLVITDIPLTVIMAVYLIGLASRFYIIMNSGGILYVLRNMGNAYKSLSNDSNGYILAIGNLMTLGMLMMIYKISFSKKKKMLVVLLFIMIALGMFSFLVYSSRSPALEMLVIVVFGYHYLIRKIHFKTLIKPKFIIAILFVAAVIVILPLLRKMSSGYSSIDYSNLQIHISIFDSIGSVLEELSTVKIDTFVYNNFNSSNYWHGANFLNLFVAWIPSSIYKNKPCVDDGIYLCNMLYGYVVSPNAGRNDLVETYSWPFTTPSCMYACFGLVGIIIGGILLGIIYRKTYRLTINKANPFTVFLYFLVIYQLELSTLSISQTLIPMIICGIVYRLCAKTTGKKAYNLHLQSFAK